MLSSGYLNLENSTYFLPFFLPYYLIMSCKNLDRISNEHLPVYKQPASRFCDLM